MAIIERILERVIEPLLRFRIVRWLSVAIAVLTFALLVRSDTPTWDHTERKAHGIWKLISNSVLVSSGLIAALLGYLAWYVLVRISDERWSRGNQSRTSSELQREHPAKGLRSTVTLIERLSEDRKQWQRAVLVDNTSTSALRRVAGQFRVEEQGVRTLELPFEVRELGPGRKALASAFVPRTGLVDTFDVFVEELIVEGDKPRRSFVQPGGKVIVDYNRLLNWHPRRAFWPRKRWYETSWLEQRVRRSVYLLMGGYGADPARRALGVFAAASLVLIGLAVSAIAVYAVARVAAEVIAAVASILAGFLERAFSDGSERRSGAVWEGIEPLR
jgi:multisubunit Na+/H+ antiporter MnhB subunit